MLNPIYPVKILHPTEIAILNTALSQLLIGDVKQLSVTRLVKLSGLSRSVFYQHFSSKEDLLAGLLLADEVGLAEAMKPALAESNLKDLLKLYLKYRLQDIDKYRLLVEIESTLSAGTEAPKRFKDWRRLRTIHADQIRSTALLRQPKTANDDQDRYDFYFGLVWTLANGVASISNTDAYTQLIKDRRGFSRYLLELLDTWIEEET